AAFKNPGSQGRDFLYSYRLGIGTARFFPHYSLHLPVHCPFHFAVRWPQNSGHKKTATVVTAF
ncbi:MAG: hypothetical protein ACRCVK_20280, partial [Aeromonas veronii]